jgi:hypothetical protein
MIDGQQSLVENCSITGDLDVLQLQGYRVVT